MKLTKEQSQKVLMALRERLDPATPIGTILRTPEKGSARVLVDICWSPEAALIVAEVLGQDLANLVNFPPLP